MITANIIKLHYQSMKKKKTWRNTRNNGKTVFPNLPKITALGDC